MNWKACLFPLGERSLHLVHSSYSILPHFSPILLLLFDFVLVSFHHHFASLMFHSLREPNVTKRIENCD